ncbi:hypothetical protein JHK87_045313 [Glycine soja]|nr:hypothetical protein JHK87_045313 [Glycine soja]
MLGLFIEIDLKLWSDPTHFNPERFENESEVNKLLPFGLGRMTYPGANLAQRTVSLTLVLSIQCFKWKRTTKKEIDRTEGKGLTVSKKIFLRSYVPSVPITDS